MRIPRQIMTTASWPVASVGVPLLITAVWVPILLSVMSTVPTQLRLWRRADQLLDRMVLKDGESFDFIVVGAGLAGGVVANRLTRSGAKVLLLEAGGEPHPFQIVPGLLMGMINYPETDWMFRSVPQTKASLNSIRAESSWSVGKGLGGTGTLNIMIYLRGHRKDFDNWASLVNDSSWSFEGLMPNFKSIEEYSGKMVKVDERYHGRRGDMLIDEPDYLGISDEFIAAAGEFGYPKVDMNSPYGAAGFDRIKYPIREGRRIASYSAFIQPVRHMETLTVLKYANVNKVLIDSNGNVYGVEYEKFGEIKTALATKEVILSAGTVNSAKILMLSGIGPKEELSRHGIPLKQDLPVGHNLQDHLGVYLGPFYVSPPAQTLRMERDLSPSSFSSWLTSGTGPLSSSGVQASGTFTSSIAASRGQPAWPDVHLFLFGYSSTSSVANLVAHAFNLEPVEMQEYYKQGDVDGRDSFYLIVTGARPLSRGWVRLKSSIPGDPPLIQPNYLGDGGNQTDLAVLLEAVKRSVEMVEDSTSMGKNLGAVFTNDKLPGCELFEMRSDEYWKCYISRYSVSLHHPVGTARMGRADDPLAVVDTRLRVRGIKGLRVVDSSIQPVIIVTNLGASAMMIGDKGAEMILQDWAQVKVKEAKNRQEERLDAGKSNGISENEEDLDFNRLKRKRRLD